MTRPFTETEKEQARIKIREAYNIGYDKNLFTVYYMHTDAFDCLNSGCAYFTHHYDMMRFVTDLEDRCKKNKQTYYFTFDGDFRCNN